MFQELLHLDLKAPHNKQLYSLKRNQFIPKNTNKPINFDSIHYQSEDIMEKLTYKIVTSTAGIVNKQRDGLSTSPMTSLTITFNYNLQAKDLILLISKLLMVKTFKTFSLAHFQIKNGHISDYHKNTTSRYFPIIDDMDQFEKDIDIALKVDNLWKLNDILEFRKITQENFGGLVEKENLKFGKRTNQFFILNVNERVQLVFILLPRIRDLVLTKEEEKQIQQLYLLQKNAEKTNLHQQNIMFQTPMAQLIKNYLSKAINNYFVSCYPQEDRGIEAVLKLPLRMSQPHEEQIKAILEQYNKDTQAELEKEFEKAKKKLKETEIMVKNEEQNVKVLVKTYTKLFARTQPSLFFLKDRGVKNVYNHIDWLKKKVEEKQAEIRQEQQGLKKLHRQIIQEQKRHHFYIGKINEYKQNCKKKQSNHTTSRSTVLKTGMRSTPRNSNIYNNSYLGASHSQLSHLTQKVMEERQSRDKENQIATEQLLLYFYDPQKEITKYREIKERQYSDMLDTSDEKVDFLKAFQEAKKKLSYQEYSQFQRKYFDLIHS